MILTTEFINNLPLGELTVGLKKQYIEEVLAFKDSRIFLELLTTGSLQLAMRKDTLETLISFIIVASWLTGMEVGRAKKEYEILEEIK